MSTPNKIQIKTLINKASRQIKNDITTACGPQLLEKTIILLKNQNIWPDKDLKIAVEKEVRSEQIRIINKYIKKGNCFSDEDPWGFGGQPLRMACQTNNIEVLRTLLKAGLNPLRPTGVGQEDYILNSYNSKIVQTVIEFYPTKQLNLICDSPKPKSSLTAHTPWYGKTKPWIIKIMKNELLKRILDKKDKGLDIEI